jgi:hypothetical protein
MSNTEKNYILEFTPTEMFHVKRLVNKFVRDNTSTLSEKTLTTWYDIQDKIQKSK